MATSSECGPIAAVASSIARPGGALGYRVVVDRHAERRLVQPRAHGEMARVAFRGVECGKRLREFGNRGVGVAQHFTGLRQREVQAGRHQRIRTRD